MTSNLYALDKAINKIPLLCRLGFHKWHVDHVEYGAFYIWEWKFCKRGCCHGKIVAKRRVLVS